MLDSQSSGPGFETRSDHYLDLFLGSPGLRSSAMLINSQLVCLWPVGILDNVMFNLNYLFQLFALPTSICGITLARVNKGYYTKQLSDSRQKQSLLNRTNSR